MIKLVLISFVLACALAAPAADPGKTPASTSKLTPIVTPIFSPIAHIPFAAAPIIPQVSPYAYSYSAPIAPAAAVAYVPESYSIEQHGYNIKY